MSEDETDLSELSSISDSGEDYASSSESESEDVRPTSVEAESEDVRPTSVEADANSITIGYSDGSVEEIDKSDMYADTNEAGDLRQMVGEAMELVGDPYIAYHVDDDKTIRGFETEK